MTKLILARHGHVEGISPERFRGRAELPLTAAGRREAELTAARIAASWRPAAIYTSPMGRCVDTGGGDRPPRGPTPPPNPRPHHNHFARPPRVGPPTAPHPRPPPPRHPPPP